jgi:hypothetical protein
VGPPADPPALTVHVPVAARVLLNVSGLPRRLDRLVPAATSVPVTLLNRPALGQARTAVHLTDTLSRILFPADLAVAPAGLTAARPHRSPAPATRAARRLDLGRGPGHPRRPRRSFLTHAAGSPLVTAATGALTTPLTVQLELTSAICAAAVALLLAAPRLVSHRHSDTSAPALRKRRISP